MRNLNIGNDVLLFLCSDSKRSGHILFLLADSTRLHPADLVKGSRQEIDSCQMGLTQSKVDYLVSRQSDTDEITNIRSWTWGHLGWLQQLVQIRSALVNFNSIGIFFIFNAFFPFIFILRKVFKFTSPVLSCCLYNTEKPACYSRPLLSVFCGCDPTFEELF